MEERTAAKQPKKLVIDEHDLCKQTPKCDNESVAQPEVLPNNENL